MQESLFDVFGTHSSVAPLKQNPRQAISLSSGESLAVPGNLKLKSSSASRGMPLKRALRDVGNKLQPPRPILGQEVIRKPQLPSSQQKTPSVVKSATKIPLHNLNPSKEKPPFVLKSTTKTPLQTLNPSKENNHSLEVLSPVLQKLSINQFPQNYLRISAIDFNSEPEIFPNTDNDEDTVYEDLFFPKRERLTIDDIYRGVTFCGHAEIQHINAIPDIINVVPPCEIPMELLQPLEVEIPIEVNEDQIPLPDLLCIDCACNCAV